MLDYDSSFTQQKAVNLLIMLIIAYIWLIYMWFIQSADLSTTYFLWGATVWHLRLYIFLFIYFFWFITGSLLRLCFCEIHVSKADSYRRENNDFYLFFFFCILKECRQMEYEYPFIFVWIGSVWGKMAGLGHLQHNKTWKWLYFTVQLFQMTSKWTFSLSGHIIELYIYFTQSLNNNLKEKFII